MGWEKAASLADLQRGPVLHKSPPRQIAVFLVDGVPYAVDNRCPHEGYPLTEGSVDGENVLTCNWHNWRFRLSDGACLLGGDDVRAYPASIREHHVWVDVSEPPVEETRAKVLQGLRGAYEDRDQGRIAREITRLHFNKLDPQLALSSALEWSHDRFEYGTTHAYAAASDWLALSLRYAEDWERRLVCLAEAVDHIAHDALRHEVHAYPQPGTWSGAEAFAQAIESRDRELAEAMVIGGLADGVHWDEMEPGFARAALWHYNDFGHSAIWVVKADQWIGLAGPEVERWLLPPLARSLSYSTREDLVPEFKSYAAAVATPAPADATDGGRPDIGPLFGSSVRKAMDWVLQHEAEAAIDSLYDGLLEAAARHMLHFDLAYQSAYDRPVSSNVGWLDFTHAITFSNAVRSLCTRHPDLWRRGLLQMACFVGRNGAAIDTTLDVTPWAVDDEQAFLAETHETLLDHGLRDPIFSCHLLKTTLAIEAELPGASASCRAALLAALNRFLHSPLKQKHARRLARQAIALVGRDFA
jgi:nitrite reductase/ring-hydroxylating ferredoxin subunit